MLDRSQLVRRMDYLLDYDWDEAPERMTVDIDGDETHLWELDRIAVTEAYSRMIAEGRKVTRLRCDDGESTLLVTLTK